ncbi:MAG: DUF1634 domain-containing protein [Chloroflexota bacterium]
MHIDRATYRWAGIILRVGMYSSFTIMLLGLVWAIAGSTAGTPLSYQTIPLSGLYDAMLAGNPDAVLSLGLLLLLASPGVTLLASMVTFAAARNWRFAGLAAISAGILLLSVVIALQ